MHIAVKMACDSRPEDLPGQPALAPEEMCQITIDGCLEGASFRSPDEMKNVHMGSLQVSLRTRAQATEVSVRNTFVSIEEEGPGMQLLRARSAPLAPPPGCEAVSSDGEESDNELANRLGLNPPRRSAVPVKSTGNSEGMGFVTSTAAPPPPPGLDRVVTHDGFEDHGELHRQSCATSSHTSQEQTLASPHGPEGFGAVVPNADDSVRQPSNPLMPIGLRVSLLAPALNRIITHDGFDDPSSLLDSGASLGALVNSVHSTHGTVDDGGLLVPPPPLATPNSFTTNDGVDGGFDDLLPLSSILRAPLISPEVVPSMQSIVEDTRPHVQPPPRSPRILATFAPIPSPPPPPSEAPRLKQQGILEDPPQGPAIPEPPQSTPTVHWHADAAEVATAAAVAAMPAAEPSRFGASFPIPSPFMGLLHGEGMVHTHGVSMRHMTPFMAQPMSYIPLADVPHLAVNKVLTTDLGISTSKSSPGSVFDNCKTLPTPSQLTGSAGQFWIEDAKFAGAAVVAKHVWWKIDAKKLQGCDKVAISPSFELSFNGGPLRFKVMLCPKATAEGRGGFRKAKGRGSVKLKCEEEPPADTKAIVSFQISVGGGGSDGKLEMASRGPVTHDFAQMGVAGLKPGQDDWNFKKTVDEATSSFAVRLDIVMGSL